MFENWLKETSALSESSIYKYSNAVNTLSREMKERDVIAKPIQCMELYEIDLAISLIFKNGYFLTKNQTGNNMYSCALKWYRAYVHANIFDMTEVSRAENRIERDKTILKTERESIVKSRIGQGIFREKVLRKYGSCIVTGIDTQQLLIASHIKPWAVSTNRERISENNGLLLSATYDRLFDSGLITFVPGGRICVSRNITKDNQDKLGIKAGERYQLYENTEMKIFLEYHNDMVFIN